MAIYGWWFSVGKGSSRESKQMISNLTNKLILY